MSEPSPEPATGPAADSAAHSAAPPAAEPVAGAAQAGGAIRPTMMRPAPPRPVWQIVLGAALVIPAFVPLIVSYGYPVGWTIRTGLHRTSLLRLGGAATEGGWTAEGYRRAFDQGLGGSFGYALSLAIVPIIVVLIGAPVLAWGAHQGGTIARWVTRVLFALPLAAYAPAGMVLAQYSKSRQHDPATFGAQVRGWYWLGTFGLVAALATTLYLATLRRRDPVRRPWPAVGVAAVIAVFAVVAAALQEFTYTFFGNRHAQGPVNVMLNAGFRNFDFNTAAAASTLLLIPLTGLGLLTTVLLVLSGARIEFDDRYRSADAAAGARPGRRPIGPVVGAVALVVLLGITIWGLAPLLGRLGEGAPPNAGSAGRIFVNTWLPPLISSLVGVLVAAPAAVGIGWLRPLGRYSELLLLPFGLFLFVGVAPLALRGFAGAQTADRLDTFWGLVPPTWLAIPALMVLTLMLRGQALRGEALRQEGRTVPPLRLLLPVLPMIGVVFLTTWVMQAQDVVWPFVSANSPDRQTGPLIMLRALGEYGSLIGDGGVSPVLPVALFLVLLLLVIGVQLAYLDRIAVRVGRPERDTPPRT